MQKFIVLIWLLTSVSSFGQKDSLQLGDSYTEDQLYVTLAYNQLFDQPAIVGASGFSYSFSGGFIKDVPFTKRRNVSLGIGIGYGFDSFNHELKVTNTADTFIFSVDNSISANKLVIHTIEFPVEFRWRTSTAKKFKFWRVYAGVKFGYNLSNKFTYVENSATIRLKNIPDFRKFQYGFTISAGYDAFNIYTYYGLTPILENAFIGADQINTKILKIGLIFYIL